MSAAPFTSVDDIRKYLPANIQNDIDNIRPFLNDAARDYVIPFLGSEEYSDLVSHYPDELTENDQKLLDYVQQICVHFAYERFAASGTLDVTDQGFLRYESDLGKSAYQWQMRDFRESRLADGYAAIDAMNRFLYENYDQYTSWYDSQERKNWNSTFLWNTNDFRQTHRIRNAASFFALTPSIRDIEEETLKGLLSKELYSEMIGRVISTELNEDDLELIPMIRRFLVFQSIASVAKNAGYEFTAQGIQIVLIDNSSQNMDKRSDVSMSSRQILFEDYSQKAEKAKNRIIQFLNANATTEKYAGYYNKYLSTPATDQEDNNTGKGVVFFGI